MAGDLVQIIDAQYVDQGRLIELLKHIYGENNGQNNFRVEA